MSQSTNKKQRELLNTQSQGDETLKESYSNNSREPINGTPFVIVKREGRYTLVMGQYALTEAMDSAEELSQYMVENEWNIMANMVHAMLDFHGLINHEEKIKEMDKAMQEMRARKAEE